MKKIIILIVFFSIIIIGKKTVLTSNFNSEYKDVEKQLEIHATSKIFVKQSNCVACHNCKKENILFRIDTLKMEQNIPLDSIKKVTKNLKIEKL